MPLRRGGARRTGQYRRPGVRARPRASPCHRHALRLPALNVTGEPSIHGNVNRVDSIPEKLSAALHHGRKTMVMPASNAIELARLLDLTTQLDVRPVQAIAERVAIALDRSSADRTEQRVSGASTPYHDRSFADILTLDVARSNRHARPHQSSCGRAGGV
ncbi:S16 family serine protease [Sorangium sp. So ce448]|uniref:S16 family serine protease n=1 Tax=Sorangium sp. So ce448 TaxID=3133314 RepID=UPI003F5E71C0